MDINHPYSLKLTAKRGSGKNRFGQSLSLRLILGITVLGGISNKNKKLIWVTGAGSNTKTTKTMLIQIVKASK
jgi:hypothetical protein